MQYWKGCERVQIVILLKSGQCGCAGDSRLIIYDMKVRSVVGRSTMTQQNNLFMNFS